MDLYEQMDIFELLDTCFRTSMQTALPVMEDKAEDTQEEMSSYLRREEKILSIARERMKRMESGWSITDLEKKLFVLTYRREDSLDVVLQKMARVVRKYIRGIEQEPERIAVLKRLIDIPVEIEVIGEEGIHPGVYRWVCGKRPQKFVKVMIRETGYPAMTACGTLYDPQRGKYRNILFQESSYSIVDMGTLLSFLILLNKVKEDMRNHPDLAEKCKGMLSEKYELTGFGNCMRDGLTKESFQSHPVFELECQDPFLEERLLQWFPDADIYYERKKGRQAVYLDGNSAKRLLGYFFPYECFMEYGISYHFLLQKSRNGIYWALPHTDMSSSPYARIILEMWKATSDVQGGRERQFASYVESRTGYARSFETKKNIPKKIVDAMEHSILNQYFGYVEYDELVDLLKVAEIEKEFMAFKETWFPDMDVKDNSVRFRRLGKQKAAGLYYPALQCLCVDINNPSSFIHEFGHLIDYTFDSLSLKDDFLPIISFYSDLLRRRMDEDETFKLEMQKKSKYNLQYYIMPTEIFARCFEMYR